MPTKEQLEELKDKCNWIWDANKKSYIVVGPNGKSIFLPAAGYRSCDGAVGGVGSIGVYWSSTPRGLGHAWSLGFDAGEVHMGEFYRCLGRFVRLVQD